MLSRRKLLHIDKRDQDDEDISRAQPTILHVLKDLTFRLMVWSIQIRIWPPLHCIRLTCLLHRACLAFSWRS